MTPTAFSTPSEALRFILAGNAYITLRSEKTQTRYTFRIAASKDNQLHFVSYLNGPSNTDDYVYLGMIRGDVFSLTRKSSATPETVVYRAFQYMWQRLVKGEFAANLEIWHEGRCGRCGRMLTVPESIANGIGPECARKVQFKVELVA